ncbi:uncharacterized protein BDR25DRAFT_355654 [Lindgomyces ingoldianus]|uniref:Uncharacterized protein n=1 Tax=Lindgomyces ingoldianus TaxID=673940 RepID=A0ACB6QVL6_9PLEO|nr:uncharacterized protein BDR25DRAFT_355654 [Lindgomyces ingoldianus]KAF2470545.1 hypothetical protein BDR25DRAFT_355654 [Lindgomyces ingoldianus]
MRTRRWQEEGRQEEGRQREGREEAHAVICFSEATLVLTLRGKDAGGGKLVPSWGKPFGQKPHARTYDCRAHNCEAMWGTKDMRNWIVLLKEGNYGQQYAKGVLVASAWRAP